ncbi:MAG: hypothetical protein K2H93_02935 [Oscillospiraceae bacterium]|nr:hypothetical protein [Oscillospiraceae bacterium]
MNEILNHLIHILKSDNSDFEIYTCFDAIPVARKSNHKFIIISPEKIKLNSVFPDDNKTISEFTADVKISVLMPMTTPSDKILEFFYADIFPKMQEAGCLCYQMQANSPEIDLKIQKLVYHAVFSLHGIYIPEVKL